MSGLIRRRHDLVDYDNPRLFSGPSFRDQRRRSIELDDDFGLRTSRRLHHRHSLEDLTMGETSSYGGHHREETLCETDCSFLTIRLVRVLNRQTRSMDWSHYATDGQH